MYSRAGLSQVSITLLRELKGLRVQVIHPPDAQGITLVQHLCRIGCSCETAWPIPESVSPTASVVFASIEQENREAIRRLFLPLQPSDPALLAVVSFEDPNTVQIVLDCGALGVIEKPIRPFGLLSTLTIARSLWLERQAARKRMNKLERRLAASSQITRAKSILMQTQGITEQVAYESIRKQAMAKRVSMEELSNAIIRAHELLTCKQEDA